jgi:hypothetical protein
MPIARRKSEACAERAALIERCRVRLDCERRVPMIHAALGTQVDAAASCGQRRWRPFVVLDGRLIGAARTVTAQFRRGVG